MAAKVVLPIIGVPVQPKAMAGLDSLLSIVQSRVQQRRDAIAREVLESSI